MSLSSGTGRDSFMAKDNTSVMLERYLQASATITERLAFSTTSMYSGASPNSDKKPLQPPQYTTSESDSNKT
ncbi:hypothetical protein QBC38DRAFT_462045 [Podospora fimiseda]|uniref:Uncharacterized protein n=1 Tax=Podospora fimiseda TaxID=252190 RepID=A0AAN7BEK6_9PEZI|nr:hypothetical protein QBC38DRAFT_462045 [Podospora fimiseda]